MGRQTRPTRVFRTVAERMRAQVTPKMKPMQAPPWHKVMMSHPPSEVLTRPGAVQLQDPNPRQKRPKNVYKPQLMAFPEDQLRQTFYRDHPWELARPRIMVEADGRDGEVSDWSKGVMQRGIFLSGENVVQRQLWLMENEGLARDAAYDKARREFYEIRQQDQIEQRIAREEARFVGAYFDKSRLEIGHEMESREFERWKEWAGHETPRYKLGGADKQPPTLAAEDASQSLLGAILDSEPAVPSLDSQA